MGPGTRGFVDVDGVSTRVPPTSPVGVMRCSSTLKPSAETNATVTTEGVAAADTVAKDRRDGSGSRSGTAAASADGRDLVDLVVGCTAMAAPAKDGAAATAAH